MIVYMQRNKMDNRAEAHYAAWVAETQEKTP
jgi:hypothetical protein